MKRTSLTEPMASDGSNSSRKENVPPEVMICIVSCTAFFICFFLNFPPISSFF